MELLPETTLGNFFNRQTRTTTTYQLIETVSGTRQGRGGCICSRRARSAAQPVHGHERQRARADSARRRHARAAARLRRRRPTQQAINSTDVALFAQDRVQPNNALVRRVRRAGSIATASSERLNLTPRVGSGGAAERGRHRGAAERLRALLRAHAVGGRRVRRLRGAARYALCGRTASRRSAPMLFRRT